jgi:DNA (cytosine-5)-methyltransferase 1
LHSIQYSYICASSDEYSLAVCSVLLICTPFLWLSGTKRRRAKPHKSKDETIEDGKLETKFHNDNKENNGTNENGHEAIVCKRPKRTAACSNFKENESDLSEEDSLVRIKEIRTEEEIEAVRLTKTGPEDKKPCRKLIDFILHDENGNVQPFEMSQSDGISITALVMPLDDNMEKGRENGIHCVRFHPITDWKISGYKEGTAAIWLSTEISDYKCVKPASSYKFHFDLFSQKARICVEVYRKLARSAGGNPLLALDELLASVVRSINSNRSFNGTVSKDFVISIGEFIHSQLTALDHTVNSDDEILSMLPALVALRNDCRSRMQFSMLPAMTSNGTLMIKDGQGKEVNENEDEDAKLARLLQEEEEWKMMQQRNKHGTSQKNVYIKISEAEIANDYPLPAYYKPHNAEMDEYIFDSDAGLCVDDLPVRILNNWALYNSDSRLISLELIPMKSGAENDIVIFGSGFMREDDDSCCSTAEPTQLSSSASKSDQEDQGISVYLSPIKEWVVEFGGSMICISIRTDIAW